MRKNFYYRFLLIFVVVILGLFIYVSAETVDSGSCGPCLTYIFDDEGTLTINGTGTMTASDAPWKNYRNSIKKVVISEGVENISDQAFFDCEGMTSITIPNSLKTIGYLSLGRCISLTEVNISENSQLENIESQGLYRCSSLESITIPSGVENIGEGAFRECFSLSRIDVKGDNKIYSSDVNGVLYDKEKKTLIQYPIGSITELYTIPASVEIIEYNSFKNSFALKHIEFEKNSRLKEVGSGAFSDCRELLSVTFADNTQIQKIYAYSFEYCVKLEKMDFGKGTVVEFIDDGVFSDCYNLSHLSIPEGVDCIGKYLVCRCSNLESITFPATVSKIDIYAFFYCGSLKDVYYMGSEAQWDAISIGTGNEYMEAATIHFNYSPVADIVYGDINGDGKVDVSDVITLLQLLASGDISMLEESRRTASDVNGDERIDVSDVIRILQYLASPGTSLNPND